LTTITQPLSFYSTNGHAPEVDLKGALLQGQAPDRGLYMPREFPAFSRETFASFRTKAYHEIATEVLSAYAHGIVEPELMAELCRDAYDYPVPLEHVYDRVHVMRLDQGPTASFKDFAARMMARLVGHFLRQEGREITILTATSGDTGSAVASAFHGVQGTRVLVLFPIDEVSDRQRKQMTTLTGNIRTIAVDGKFDDCQAMVKHAFADPDLAHIALSSANSINVGRLLPQSVYYIYAWSRLTQRDDEELIVAVPSGNFGNMMGCVFANRTGMPLKRLVVPVNENDEFPKYLNSDRYSKIEPSKACISNAMNVGNPSNLARLVDLYGGHLDQTGCVLRAPKVEAMRRDLFSTSVSDEGTRATIKEAWQKHKLLLEPHGAVGWRGFQDYIAEKPLNGAPAVVVETAHPAKFPDEIRRILDFDPEVPPSLARLEELPEDFDSMKHDYDAFKSYLKKHYS
jgi:threonine synthase